MLLAKRDYHRNRFPDFNLFGNSSLFDDLRGADSLVRKAHWVPPMDVSETDSEYKVRLEAPGIEKDDIKAELEDGVLTISGEKKSEVEDKSEKRYCVERSYGRFSRRLRFSDIDSEKISATFKNGVLEVTLSKVEAAKPKQISIQQN